MRRLAFGLLAVLLGACSDGGAVSPVTWENDYASALKKAKAEGKPVLIDFHADW